LANRASGQGQRTEILPAEKWNAKKEFIVCVFPVKTACPAYGDLNFVQIILLTNQEKRGHLPA